MTYQEIRRFASIIFTVLVTGIYALIVYQRYMDGVYDTSNIMRFWALVILLFIPITIVLRIVMEIIIAIIKSIVLTAKGENIDELEIVDERDKLIELKTTKISLFVFSVGFILALVSQAMSMSVHMFFIIIVITGVITEIIQESLSIFFYRRGLWCQKKD